MAKRTAPPTDAALVREAIVAAMKRSSMSREQIADAMTNASGTRVTERMLCAFAATSREDHRFPVELIRPFCSVLKDYSLLRAVAESCGLVIAGPREQREMAVGRAVLQRQRLARTIAKAQAELEELDRKQTAVEDAELDRLLGKAGAL